MKKIYYLALTILLIYAFPVDATTIFETSSSTVLIGESFTVDVKIEEIAAWNIHVKSTGPVKDCTIDEVDVTEDAKNTSKAFSVSCKAYKQGTITFKLTGDTTTEDGKTETLSNSIDVEVLDEEIKEDNNLLDNTILKELEVKGFEIHKDNNYYYWLKVDPSVKKIIIVATPKDSKATVTGDGEFSLKRNNTIFEIVVTSESGSSKTYYLEVNKEKGGQKGPNTVDYKYLIIGIIAFIPIVIITIIIKKIASKKRHL